MTILHIRLFYPLSLSLLLLSTLAYPVIITPDWADIIKDREPRLHMIYRNQFIDPVMDPSPWPSTWGEVEERREQQLNYDREHEERKYLEHTLVDAYNKEPVDWAVVAGVMHCLRVPDLNDTVLSIAEEILSSVKEFSDKELYVVEEAIHVLTMAPDQERLLFLEQYLEPDVLGLVDDYESSGQRRSSLSYGLLDKLSVSLLSIEEKRAIFQKLHDKYSAFEIQEPSRPGVTTHPVWYTPRPTTSRYQRHYAQIKRYVQGRVEFFNSFSPEKPFPPKHEDMAVP